MTSHNEKIGSTDKYVVEKNILEVVSFSKQIYRVFLKRVFDILIVLFLAPVILPVLGILLITVYLKSGSPLYAQYRVGKGGTVFKMWKIRTMVMDAETVLDKYLEGNPAARVEWDCFQKLDDDPRITSIGTFLRETSMDELPQLWNVLIGDMSLVGPRPMMVEQKSLYPGSAYYLLRPGITGFWQISDRNSSSFAARSKFDTEYERSVSFATDIRTLVSTVKVVFERTGR